MNFSRKNKRIKIGNYPHLKKSFSVLSIIKNVLKFERFLKNLFWGKWNKKTN
ncbi:MAG: hypothetical protein ACD_71C00057G0001, partial [uncultured bacterium (gcode 4)]